MKVRVISDIPVMDENGNVLHVKQLAGPADERASVDTSDLANGTHYFESDTGNYVRFDEDAGWDGGED